jgi:ribA/ribD-fused uncharacterized protein
VVPITTGRSSFGGIKMRKTIGRFTGQYNFLSNFEKCAVQYEGVVYPSIEAAYQAAKTLDPEKRIPFETCQPGKAKIAGKKLELRPDWDKIRLGIMYDLVKQKFSMEPHRSKLLETGGAELIEGNYWCDSFYGVYRGKGENHLGKIIMRVREELKNENLSHNQPIERKEVRRANNTLPSRKMGKALLGSDEKKLQDADYAGH